MVNATIAIIYYFNLFKKSGKSQISGTVITISNYKISMVFIIFADKGKEYTGL
jgi:hypothetical protein